MKTKTIRVSVDLLEKLEEKLVANGRAPEMLKEHLGIYINEILWTYAEKKNISQGEWGELYEKFKLLAEQGFVHGIRNPSVLKDRKRTPEDPQADQKIVG